MLMVSSCLTHFSFLCGVLFELKNCFCTTRLSVVIAVVLFVSSAQFNTFYRYADKQIIIDKYNHSVCFPGSH